MLSIDFGEKYAFVIAAVVFNTVIWFISVPPMAAIEILIGSSTIAAVGLCVFIGANEWESISRGMTRIGSSASGNVNAAGLWLGILSTLCLYKASMNKNLVYKGSYALQIVFALLTGSKKALMLIFMGLAFLASTRKKLRIHQYVLAIALIAGTYYLIMNNSYLYPIIGQRVVNFSEEVGFSEGVSKDESTAERIEMTHSGWQIFGENPLFGHGRGYFAATSGFGTYSHNNYIELLVSYGIVGLLLYYGMFIYVLAGLLFKLRHNDHAKFFLVLIVMIMFSDMASVSFYNSPCNYLMLFFAGLIVSGSYGFVQNEANEPGN